MLFRRSKAQPEAPRPKDEVSDTSVMDRFSREWALEQALKVAQLGEAPKLTVSRAQSFYDFIKSA